MVVLDTSALLKRYVDEEGTALVLDLMAADRDWCASSLALAEAQVALCQLELDEDARREQIGALKTDWDFFRVVPVDHLCLARAAEIGCTHRVRALDAIHLAGADRLPRPLVFLTFDSRQAAVARELDLELAP
jgi:predicted nucleic acid-binding protein